MILSKKLRYIMIESSEPVRMDDLRTVDSLKAQLSSFLGELPYFKTNPQITTQLSEHVFVISVNRGYERNAILALSFVKKLDEKKLGLYTIRTSGSMRSIRNVFRKLY